jgi:hypothetical protein
MTDDNLLPFCFPAVRRKKITAAFDGGRISSDGGVMLLAQAHFRDVIFRVRGWLDRENVQPTTFRYWLYEPASVLRVNFELEEQAQSFAQAFGGVVLV